MKLQVYLAGCGVVVCLLVGWFVTKGDRAGTVDAPVALVEIDSVEGSMALQERLLADYQTWPTEERNIAMCFAEDTPEEIVWMWSQALYGDAYELAGRWSPSTQGEPITLRWSIVPDGTSWSGGLDSVLQSTLDTHFGSREVWEPLFQQVFARWTYLTGITFVQVDDDGAGYGASGSSTAPRGDLRIGGRVIDGPGSVLAFNAFPGGGSGGDMTMDTSENWDGGPSDFRFFRNTVAHEVGHGIGLEHVCPGGGKLMGPSISTGFDGPQHDDIRGAQRHYGDRFETNDTSSAVVDLGSIGPVETFVVDNVSSDDNSDSADWYKFSFEETDRLVTIRLVPVGMPYTVGPQTTACDTGTAIDSSDDTDLALRLYESDASTIIADESSLPAGEVEGVFEMALEPGEYYVRVTNGGNNVIQLYQLEVTVACLFPSVVDAPDFVQTCPGETAMIPLDAIDTDTYQWYRNGVAVPGATDETLVIEDVTPFDAGMYTAEITNFCTTVESDPVLLIVRDPALITTQPQSQEFAPGASGALFVTSGGSIPLTFQWFKNGAPIPEATGFFYQIVGADCDDAGVYTAEATNPCGTVASQQAIVTVTGCIAAGLGDCDEDGDVDLVDFGSFQLCYGATGDLAAGGCLCSDFDSDSDVDLVDFASFQLAFTGSE